MNQCRFGLFTFYIVKLIRGFTLVLQTILKEESMNIYPEVHMQHEGWAKLD